MHFTNACFDHLFQLLDIHPTQDISEEQLMSLTQFRGIYPMFPDSSKPKLSLIDTPVIGGKVIGGKVIGGKPDTKEVALSDKLYVFIEMNQIIQKNNVVWATVHELMNIGRINHVLISPNVVAVFDDEPGLMYITDNTNIPITIPYVLYPTSADHNNDKTTNIDTAKYAIIQHNPTNNDSSIDVLHLTRHKYGYYHMFSKLDLAHPDVVGRRYVVFADNTLYMIGTDAENDVLYTNTINERTFSSIYFIDSSGIPRWGVRSIDDCLRL